MSLPQNPSICVPHVVQKLGLTDLWLQNGEMFSREPSCVCVQLDRRCPLNGSPAVCCLTAQEAALVAVPNFKGFLLPRAVSNCEFIAEISLFFFSPPPPESSGSDGFFSSSSSFFRPRKKDCNAATVARSKLVRLRKRKKERRGK